MFISKNRVRLYDTDMVGILYFAAIYRFSHDAWEEMLYSEGHSFEQLLREAPQYFVIVHSEADYIASLHVEDQLEVEMRTHAIGNTSFTLAYDIFKVEGEERQLMSRVKTVHCCIERATLKKTAVPAELRKLLSKYA